MQNVISTLILLFLSSSAFSQEECTNIPEFIIETDKLYSYDVWANAQIDEKTIDKTYDTHRYYGDPNGLIGMKVCGNALENGYFSLIVSCPEIMIQTPLEGKLKKGNNELFPHIAYFYDKFKLNGSKMTQVNMKLIVNGKIVYDRYHPLEIIGTDYLPYLYHHRRSAKPELKENTISYVLKEFSNSVAIQDLYKLCRRYYIDTQEDKLQQANAVFHVIRMQNLKFKSENDVYQTSHIIAQSIKKPINIMTERIGNCFDLSLLYASTLRGLGIESTVIFSPNHTYVNFTIDKKSYNIETTILTNTQNIENSDSYKSFIRKIPYQPKKGLLSKEQEKSWYLFQYATSIR